MKLKKTNCICCGGIIDLQVNENCSKVFCPYCGQRYEVDSDKQEIEINENVRVTSRHIDDADVIRAKTEARQKKIGWRQPLMIAFAIILVWATIMYLPGILGAVARNQGKISAGSEYDYSYLSYEAAEQYLRELGFTNIILIDANNANEYRKEGEVESVTINGDSDFYYNDYFEPTDKVIIRYH